MVLNYDPVGRFISQYLNYNQSHTVLCSSDLIKSNQILRRGFEVLGAKIGETFSCNSNVIQNVCFINDNIVYLLIRFFF